MVVIVVLCLLTNRDVLFVFLGGEFFLFCFCFAIIGRNYLPDITVRAVATRNGRYLVGSINLRRTLMVWCWAQSCVVSAAVVVYSTLEWCVQSTVWL